MSNKRRTQLMMEPEQYQRLRALAEAQNTSISQLVREAVERLLEQRSPLPITEDPIWDVVASVEDTGRLIDGIAISEDPDLYTLAELMERNNIGPYAEVRDGPPHAWEIAPQRYARGESGQAVRLRDQDR
ncbi:MAG: ribbon-helix-helix domain-containing protein [Anaerolineae bacterium]|jgi:predicted DNA-binding protein